MNILTINPGGNSLKAEFVQCRAGQRYAYEAQSLLSVSIEGIGGKAKLSVLNGRPLRKFVRRRRTGAFFVEAPIGRGIKALNPWGCGGKAPATQPASAPKAGLL